jgi:uncharacterized protein (DUF924 family)
MERVDDILEFWFGPPDEEYYQERRKIWFRQNPFIDKAIRERFWPDCARAREGLLEPWRAAAPSCLALILLLDQFPRNLFRGDARAYGADAHARAVARHALGRGFDRAAPMPRRMFFYIPFEHSEYLDDQHLAVELFRSLGDDQDSQDVLGYAQKHLDVIERFGRFPHRNAVLGRASTPDELAFLKEPGSSFSGTEDSSE